MSHEVPSFSAEFSEQKPSRKLASSRSARAIMLATSLIAASPDAEAKKKPRAPAVESHHVKEMEKSEAPAKYSLSSHQDHGMEKEVDAIEHFHLENFKNEAEIEAALKDGLLVELNPGPDDGYELDPGIGQHARPEKRHLYRAVFPFVQARIESLAKEYYAKYRQKIVISSAVRTEKYQDVLRRGNSNAAQGYTSSHLKGTTVDIMYFAPETLTRTEEYRMPKLAQEWMDGRLLLMELDGLAQVTKEKQQPVYHVMFYPEKYKK